MITQEELSKLILSEFPYKTPYEGQIEAITKICEAFIFRDKIHVVLDAPTGSGKSVIAWTVMNVLKKVGLIKRSTTITVTKALQDLYTDSFTGMFPLKSKVNYDCPFNKGPYMSPECRIQTKIFGCKPKVNCPYVRDREYWCDLATFRNTNTAFMLEACGTLVLQSNRFSDFMVIDEAHRLEEMIIEHGSCVFTIDPINDINAINYMLNSQEPHMMIIKLLNLLGNLASKSQEHVVLVTGQIRDVAAKLNKVLEEFIGRINEYISVLDPNDKEDEKAISYLQQSLEILTRQHNDALILSQLKDNTRLHVLVDQGYLEVKIIDARVISYQSLFQKSSRFLHMSGTICGYHYHISKLGLNENDCELVEVDNHIPVQNRTIQALGNFRIRGNDYNSNSKAILYTDKIIEHYQGKHGFIFCPSFDMCGTFFENSRYKSRMIIPETIEEAREIMSKPDDKIIISPSVIEGIDLKDDMCRFIIIPRIPYLYLGDDIVKIKLNTEPEFYYRTTVMKLVQVCGRGVRSFNDYCDTYIFDSTFKTLVTRNGEFVPKWFNSAIKWYY